MVGKCARGNIWGNSVPNHERLLAKGRASFQHPERWQVFGDVIDGS
jgi:hypothetical protein